MAQIEKLATQLTPVTGTPTCPNGLPLEIVAPTDPQVRHAAGAYYSYARKDGKAIVWQVRENRRDVKQTTTAQQNGPVHESKGAGTGKGKGKAKPEPAPAPTPVKEAPVKAPAKAVAVAILVYTDGTVEIRPAH